METKSATENAIDEIIFRYKAGYPVIWIKTEEYLRAYELLVARFNLENERYIKQVEEKFKGVGREQIPPAIQPRIYYQWDAINGLSQCMNPQKGEYIKVFPASDGKTAIQDPPAWQHVLSWGNHLTTETVKTGAIVFVNGFHNMLAGTPASDYGRMRQSILQLIQPTLSHIRQGDKTIDRWGLREGNSYRTLIFIGPKPDHPVLSSDIMSYMEIVDLPRPSENELEKMILEQSENWKNSNGESITADAQNVSRCAVELKGTTTFQAENAITLTYVKRKALDQKTLRHQYKQIIELHPALTLAEYSENWDDLIGFEMYKEFILALTKTSKENQKGILLIGAPGTGKSHCAKATGGALGRKTLFCNLGRTMNKYMGATDENTENLFKAIDGSGDPIVYFDELEKTLGGLGKGHGGDGGTGDRMLQQVLTWWNDHNSGALVLATANDPHLLPQEFLREGRWNCIMNVPPPSLKQRRSLSETYGKKYEVNVEHAEIAARTENWVGAEIKGLLEKTYIFSKRYSNHEEALECAFKYVRPMCVADKERFMRRVEESAIQGISVNAEESEKVVSKEEVPNRQRGLELN